MLPTDKVEFAQLINFALLERRKPEVAAKCRIDFLDGKIQGAMMRRDTSGDRIAKMVYERDQLIAAYIERYGEWNPLEESLSAYPSDHGYEPDSARQVTSQNHKSGRTRLHRMRSNS